MGAGNLDFVNSSSGTVPLEQVALRLNAIDDVAIAKIALQAGTILLFNEEAGLPVRVEVRQFIPTGHKVALRSIPPQGAVRRYGQIIGFATQAILSGEH